MPQDAAASGAESDADSTQKGDTTTAAQSDADAGQSGALTQADVDKIVAAKVAQKLSKYGDLNELKTKAEEFDNLQESQKSELQKLQDRITEMERDKEKAETESRRERLHSATVRAAAKLGYADPEDAFALLPQSEVDEDGGNVEKLLTNLLKSKPYLSSGRITGSADGDRRTADKSAVDVAPGLARLTRAYEQRDPNH